MSVVLTANPGRLGLALAAALALAAPVRAQSARELLERCSPSEVAATAAKLRQLGADGAQSCIGLVVRADFSATASAQAAAREALPAFLPSLRRELAALAGAEPDTERLTRALDALGAAGELQDLGLAARLAQRFPPELEDDRAELAPESAPGSAPESAPESSPESPPAPTPEPEPSPEALDAFRQAARGIFARHAQRVLQPERLLEDCPDELARALIDALVDCKRPEGLQLLGEILVRSEQHPAPVIVAISRCARAMAPPYDPRTRAAVRARLGRGPEAGLREAVICAGWLEDEDAARELVALLEHGQAGVRADALWSLERITGQHLSADPEPWSKWLGANELWTETELPGLLADLEDDDLAQRAKALNELLRHRYPRHELARALSESLDALDGEFFRLACSGLAQLASPAALPALRALDLARLSEAEREVARRCLERLAPAPRPPRRSR